MEFDYGIIVIGYRLCVDKPIRREKLRLEKCIRMGTVQKRRSLASPYYWEVQIVYKDAENQLHCAKFDLEDRTIKIVHQGNMQIDL